jgi:hypothetical protein
MKNTKRIFRKIKRSTKRSTRKFNQKFSWKELFSLFATIAVGISGLIFNHYENKRQEEEHKKKYPKSNVEKVQAHFKERKISLDAKNQIKNTEIEDLMKNVVDLARRENLIYLVYSENGIGKSTAMKNTLLRNPDLDFLYIEKGIDELLETFVPDFCSKSEYSLEKVIDNALTDYGDYRKQMKKNNQKTLKKMQSLSLIIQIKLKMKSFFKISKI